ncbi:phosphoribosylamine--glycine ligase [Vibrio cholerae]
MLEKPFFSDYFSHAKRLREIFCNKLVRIRAIEIAADKVFPQIALLFFAR